MTYFLLHALLGHIPKLLQILYPQLERPTLLVQIMTSPFKALGRANVMAYELHLNKNTVKNNKTLKTLF